MSTTVHQLSILFGGDVVTVVNFVSSNAVVVNAEADVAGGTESTA